MKKLIAAVIAAGTLLGGCIAVEPVGYNSGYSSYGYYDNNQYSRAYPSTRPYRDSDRDGVPNWRDTRPNNPYRY